MRTTERRILFLVSIGGIGFCLTALARFLLTIVGNRLPWLPDQGIRAYYLAVGESYSRGFAVGFFLCFFLAVAAVCIGAWLDHRRASPSGSGGLRRPAGAVSSD